MSGHTFPLLLQVRSRSGNTRTREQDELHMSAATGKRGRGKGKVSELGKAYGARVRKLSRRRMSVLSTERFLESMQDSIRVAESGTDGGSSGNNEQRRSVRQLKIAAAKRGGARRRSSSGARMSREGRKRVDAAIDARNAGLKDLNALRAMVLERKELKEALDKGVENLVYSLHSSVRPDLPVHVLGRATQKNRSIMYFDAAHEGPVHSYMRSNASVRVWYKKQCHDVAEDLVHEMRKSHAASVKLATARSRLRSAQSLRAAARADKARRTVLRRGSIAGPALDDTALTLTPTPPPGPRPLSAAPGHRPSTASPVPSRTERVTLTMPSARGRKITRLSLLLASSDRPPVIETETHITPGVHTLTGTEATPALNQLERTARERRELAHEAGTDTERAGGLVRITKLGRLAHKRATSQAIKDSIAIDAAKRTTARASDVLPDNFRATFGLDTMTYGDIGAEPDDDGLFHVVVYAKSDVPYGMPLPQDYTARMRSYDRHAHVLRAQGIVDDDSAFAQATLNAVGSDYESWIAGT